MQNLMIFEAMNLHYTPAFLSLKEDLMKSNYSTTRS